MHEQILRELIGNLPKDPGFTKAMRFHQSWWRAFVLAESQGPYPTRPDRVIGNTINHGEISRKNFLTRNTWKSAIDSLDEREKYPIGKIQEKKLFNNLLASQPLCFNFFGELKQDKKLAHDILGCFYQGITKVTQVIFEYAPNENYTNDKSTFDIVFEVEQNNRLGLVGYKCKFTESFPHTEYDTDTYRNIFNKSRTFLQDYQSYVSRRYNQLFRSQLMAEAMQQQHKYDFVYTGLFCHQEDNLALSIGRKFSEMLTPSANFQVITYRDFIAKVQPLPLTWAQREWTMLLWARYCSTQLRDLCNPDNQHIFLA